MISKSNRLKLFKRLLNECLAATSEKILIIGDKGSKHYKAANFLTQEYTTACEDLGLDYEVYYQRVKKRGESADAELTNKLKLLPKKSIAIVNVSNKIGRMEELGCSFRTFMKKMDHRFISASSLGSIGTDQLKTLVDSLDINYSEVAKKAHRIKRMLDNGSEARLTSKAGTDLVYGIEEMTARSAVGLYTKPGTGGNLPGAETYIAPYRKKVEGVAVIDGSSRVMNTTRIIQNKEGIRLDIKDGAIQSMNTTSDAKELQKTLEWAKKKSAYDWGVKRIGELGIGLNPKAKIIGAMIVDEKVHGTAHLAIGSNKWFGGSITSIIHLDQVIKDATVRVDGKKIKI